jgi:Tol biopolymer transport system component
MTEGVRRETSVAKPKEVDKMKLRWAVAIVATAAFGVVPAFAASATQHDALGPTISKIAFTSKADGQADIYTMNASGKGMFNVTHDKTIGVRTDVEPVWSPSGTAVAFERRHATSGADLMVVNTDGSNLHPLTLSPVPGVWNCHPSWAGDNTVFFTSNRDGNFDLYSVSVKGTATRQLTKTSAPVQNLGPAVSPDGRTVVFSRTGAPRGGNGIFLLSLITGRLTHVIADWAGATYFDPAWSPSGSQIAYASNLMGSNDIWTVSVLNTTAHPTPMRMTYGKYSDVHPAFSPDGRTLAFVSNRTGYTEIYTTPAQGNAGTRPVTQLTFDKAFKADPSWHLVTIGPSL